MLFFEESVFMVDVVGFGLELVILVCETIVENDDLLILNCFFSCWKL